MVSNQRKLRLSQSIKREMSELLQKDLKDARLTGIISVTEVELSNDYRNCKIFISVFGTQLDKQNCFQALEDRTGFIRGEICRRLKIKFAPEILFKNDDSLERGSKISAILAKIADEKPIKEI